MTKLIRITAWCWRFYYNCLLFDPIRQKGPLTTRELTKAIQVLVKSIQQVEFCTEIKLLKSNKQLPMSNKLTSLNPFLDTQGLLRVGGRLEYSYLNENQKLPLLLPKNHHITNLIIDDIHRKYLHAGPQLVLSILRKNYWILGARDAVKKIIKKCLICLKFKSTTIHQIMGNLPPERIIPSRPFSKTSIDLTGPFLIKRSLGRSKTISKSYIVLFICFTTKAIHLELTTSLSTDSFMASLRGFMARRGKPSDIYSDNATNFKGASNFFRTQFQLLNSQSVQRLVTEELITWHFIPPGGPHFGGLWEAGIKSVKSHLVRTFKSTTLNYEEMNTLIVQIESCLNSRPLAPLSSDPNDYEALTPAHFLIGSSFSEIPTSNSEVLNLQTRWKLIQKLKNSFWSRWSKEYLSNLQGRGKWRIKQDNIQIGQLVYLKEAQISPLHWPLARIQEIFPGEDKNVRYFIKVNEIKTKKGTELLQHLVEYYHAQNNYFQDGLKTIKHFSDYISELATNLQRIRQKQDEERKSLVDLRNTLRSAVALDGGKDSLSSLQPGGYNLHPLQGNQHYGYTKSGHLLKKSDGKIKKVWQKRRCEIKDGFLYISHSDEAKPPTKLNLLTCQVKTIPEEKRYFDLVSYNRTYHFQAEDESEMEAWLAVLLNSKEGALRKAFDDSGHSGADDLNQSLLDLQQSIIRQVQKLPGNDRCVDCNSTKDPTWLSTNFGILTCIECSGIHRDMGVHISRIQSLTLDNIGTSQLLLARKMSNSAFNEVMEASLTPARKLTPSSTMDERYEFIRAKYVQKQFVAKPAEGADLPAELERAVRAQNLGKLLKVFAQGADLTCKMPSSATRETALHLAIAQEDTSSLHIVDFLVQNSTSLDRQTSEGWTPLHVCAHHGNTECMKLLLRSGANTQIENEQGRTPLDLAKEQGHVMCVELLEHANHNKKTLFENINIDWGLTQDDGSTDFSDEDFADDRGGQVTPERRSRSRPSSVVGGSESPTSLPGEGSGPPRQSPATRPAAPPHKKPSGEWCVGILYGLWVSKCPDSIF
ncbi:ASAP1 [Cordylochernes scorpioides]|uniref:ASAP1 n=1 Tax=Cordylochernes scorpioides TaxID=51811 RepID=A0ABY6JVY5_9ARAC|nr:ASAP1 [Cordylochernes scorpioides]